MSEKHKRNITCDLTEQELSNTLSTVENMIKSMPAKQQHIMSEWLETWSTYINFEASFKPEKLKYYKRGEIVLAHFGYNTGSELGGPHFAIIVENNNNKYNNNVVVVPLSSLDENKSRNDLHKSEVYLGNVLHNTNKQSYAMPQQIRAISKLRIIKPKRSNDDVIKIPTEKLEEIDIKIRKLFTKPQD